LNNKRKVKDPSIGSVSNADRKRAKSTPLPLEDLTNERLKLVLDYWHSKRGDRLSPSMSDIDPIELKLALPSLAIFDVCRDPLNFRYRLAGTEHYDILSVELTGRLVTEIEPHDFGRILWGLLSEIIEKKEPQYSEWSFYDEDGLARNFKVLRLPLSSDGKEIDKILVSSDYGTSQDKLKEYFSETYRRR
jgi:hypothetical protein